MGIAVLIASSAVAMAAHHVRRVSRSALASPTETADWLRRFPAEERVARLAARVGAKGWEGQLCADLLGAASESARLAVVNTALGDAAHELEATSRLPFVAVRMSAWAGLMLAVFAYLAGARTMTGPIITLGACGAVAAWALGRHARKLAEARRRDIDELVHVLTGGRGAPGLPSVRAKRSASSWRRS